MSQPVKLCKDCKHFSANIDAKSLPCIDVCMVAAAIDKPDFVWGDHVWRGTKDASLARVEGTACGPEGKLWEPR